MTDADRSYYYTVVDPGWTGGGTVVRDSMPVNNDEVWYVEDVHFRGENVTSTSGDINNMDIGLTIRHNDSSIEISQTSHQFGTSSEVSTFEGSGVINTFATADMSLEVFTDDAQDDVNGEFHVYTMARRVA